MKAKKYDGTTLRRILVGMVTDGVVVARISSRWRSEGLFDVSWANLVGEWCVEHYQRHQQPLDQSIRARFERWAQTTSDTEETVESVERFILGLSDTAEPDLDPAFVLDLAGDYFNGIQIKRTCELAQLEIERGLVKEADRRLQSIRRVELGEGSYAEPAKDYSVWYQAFERNDDRPLVTYPGDVGLYLADAFKRGEFYAWMGPDKTAKTTNLVDFTWRAIHQKNNVAFFDAGDSSQDEMIVRFGCRITGKPDIPCEIPCPLGWNEEGELEIAYEKAEAVSPVEAFRAIQKRTRPDSLRLSCHPNSSLSVPDISSKLGGWADDGWVADIVVIDYADILKQPEGVNPLEATDLLWKSLRRLSQERHCLVVTATQSNAAAYGNEKALLSRANFSGRKTKLAEVNGMIGINVSSDERATHQARWNWVVRRKMRNRGSAQCVHLAGCYDSENPIIISRL